MMRLASLLKLEQIKNICFKEAPLMGYVGGATFDLTFLGLDWDSYRSSYYFLYVLLKMPPKLVSHNYLSQHIPHRLVRCHNSNYLI